MNGALEDGQREVGALGIGQVEPRAGMVRDPPPGLLVEQAMKRTWKEIGGSIEVVADHPGESLVAMIDLRDRATLAVDQQVVPTGASQFLDPGESFPATWVLRPRLASHGDLDLVQIVELAVGLDLGDDDVHGCAHVAQRPGDGVSQPWVGLTVDADQDAVAGPRGAVPDEARRRPADFILPGNPACHGGQLGHVVEVEDLPDTTRGPGLDPARGVIGGGRTAHLKPPVQRGE